MLNQEYGIILSEQWKAEMKYQLDLQSNLVAIISTPNYGTKAGERKLIKT